MHHQTNSQRRRIAQLFVYYVSFITSHQANYEKLLTTVLKTNIENTIKAGGSTATKMSTGWMDGWMDGWIPLRLLRLFTGSV